MGAEEAPKRAETEEGFRESLGAESVYVWAESEKDP